MYNSINLEESVMNRLYASQKGASTLAMILLVLLIMIIYTIFIILPTPFYTVSNHDGYPHNVTVRVIGPEGEYFSETTYSLDSGESASAKKPLLLMLKWEFKSYKGPVKYEYYIESENIPQSYKTIPNKYNTVYFDLTNESGVFRISVRETTA